MGALFLSPVSQYSKCRIAQVCDQHNNKLTLALYIVTDRLDLCYLFNNFNGTKYTEQQIRFCGVLYDLGRVLGCVEML